MIFQHKTTFISLILFGISPNIMEAFSQDIIKNKVHQRKHLKTFSKTFLPPFV